MQCCLPDLKEKEGDHDLFSIKDIEAFTKKVYEGAYKDGSFDQKRVNTYAKEFSKAIREGFRSTVDFDSPDTKMLNALKDNVFHFSAAKNRTEIVAMSAALRDANGKLRTYREFTHEAKKITSDFQGRYMKVEYDLAVNAATMAARWAEYEEDAILVFRTAGDSRVRPEHALLDGIAKPKNHPFWDKYYPPLSWNCRCTVETTTSGRITPDGQIPPGAIDGVPPMFRTNFAKQGFAFPPNHPYFKNMTKKADEMLKGKSLPVIKKYKSGGKVIMQPAIDIEAGDFQRINAIGKSLAKQGRVVEILPKLHFEDQRYKELFGSLSGTPYDRKCPDLRIDGKFYEHEGYTSTNPKKAFRNMLNRGLKQANRIIIDDCGVTGDYIKRISIQRIKDGQDINEIWVNRKGKLTIAFKSKTSKQ